MTEAPTAHPPACPDEPTLGRFLDDQLPPDEDDRVGRHIESCPACERLLDRLQGGLSPDLDRLLPIRAGGDDDTPPRLAGYEVLGRLGEGGMGVVWRVRDEFGREVALKVMKTQFGGLPDLEGRFLNEASICARLTHPSIVPVHDQGRLDDGRPYYVMKLVDGPTLADKLRGRASPAERLTEWMKVFAHVCQAMAYAHGRGVIHRDLKPSNLMVGRHGEVQVMDWGVAKELGGIDAPRPDPPEAGTPGAARFFQTRGDILGTSSYMSPEQASGLDAVVDRRADVFGLGAILCEILTGTPPYTATEGESLRRQAKEWDLAEALARLRGCKADPDLIRLAERCLARDREERPADAGEVAAAVEAYLAADEERRQQERLGQVKATEMGRRRVLWMGLAASMGVAAYALFRNLATPRDRSGGVLRIGLWPYPAYAPLVVAAKMKLCDGLEVQIVLVEDIKVARQEMAARKIDASACVVDSHVYTRHGGTRAKAVLKLAPSLGADGIVAKEGIDGLIDLHGKRVAFVQHEPPHFLLIALAAKTPGFDPDKVVLRATTAVEAKRQYIAGEVDAAITWEPLLSEARQEGGGRIIASSRDVPNTIVDILTVEEDYLEKHPENVGKLIRGWFRAVDILRSDNPRRGEAIDHVCEVFGMSRAEFEELEPLSPCSSVEENIDFFAPKAGGTNGFRKRLLVAQAHWNTRYMPDSKIDIDPIAADGSRYFLEMKDVLLKEHGGKTPTR